MISFSTNKVDVDRYNKALGNIIATSKKDVSTIVNQQARLLGVQLMHFTPPFAGGKIPNGNTGTTKADQQAGIEAVRNHIFRTMTPPSEMFPDTFKDKNLEKMVKRKEHDKLQKYFDNVKGPLKGYKVKDFSPDLHTSTRTYAGRFRPKQQKVFVNDERAVQRYVRVKTKLVGYMKAGWAKAITFFGGKAPAWVTRHLGYAKGTASILNNDPDNYTVEMSNSTNGIGRFTSNFQVAVRMRTNAMARLYNEYLRKNLQKNLR